MEERGNSALFPSWALTVTVLLAGGLTLAAITDQGFAFFSAVFTAIVEGTSAAAVVAAAGGYGYLVVRRISPTDSPPGLRVVTACVLGLWGLSTTMLGVGSAVGGAMRPAIWWPVIGAGIFLGAYQARGTIGRRREPRRYDARALLWVLLAVAVGLWLAGAMRPPGWWAGVTDEYDVLEYHLQAPREFFNAGRIGQLPHNAYSYYPMGLEMLYLLAMCLRGGAYEGVYLAKLLHGAYGVLAAAGVFLALRRDEQARGHFSTGLLATTPMLIYLGWLAMVELAQVCCLGVALLWVRQWLRDASAGSAACVGLMLGAACATKYLAVGLVAAPVMAAMLAMSLLTDQTVKRLLHLAPAALAAALLFSPWLIRNFAYTRNPVFPLATGTFGRAHWSELSEERWRAGHGPQARPPVPIPAGWQPSQHRTRPENLYYNFLTFDPFGRIVLTLGGLAVCALIASRWRRFTWDWCLAGVVMVQLAVWAGATHEMPSRFICPAMAPVCLLAGGGLARLAAARANPLRGGDGQASRGPWGLMPAVGLFAAAAAVNLAVAWTMYRAATSYANPTTKTTVVMPPAHGLGSRDIAEQVFPWSMACQLPQGSRILLLGQAEAFYFPPGTIYATAFDADQLPLAQLARRGLSGEEIIGGLLATGCTHIWVNWDEVLRLARTYGYPPELAGHIVLRRREGLPAALPILEKLQAAGLRVVREIPPVRPTSAPAGESIPATASSPTSGPSSAPAEPTEETAPATGPAAWPQITIYALPR